MTIQPTLEELKSLDYEQSEQYKISILIHGKSAKAKRNAFNSAKKIGSAHSDVKNAIFKNGKIVYC